jgi:GGDEF domain-containing protein
MFQNRRQATLGNINLGNLSTAPTFQDMNFLREQAQRYRGRFVEVSWHYAKTGATFQLTAKYPPNQSEPTWMLYRGVGSASELVWGHTSNDLTLMNNLVMLECEKPVDGSDNSISAGALDGMISSNEQVGAVVAGHTGSRKPGAQTPTQAPATASASAGNAGNPAATWLQNLTQSQTAAEKTPPTPDVVMDKLAAVAGTDDGADESPVFAGSASGELILDGSLTNITIPKLLRYLAHNGLTGRLALQGSVGAAEVFFLHGRMTHAATLDAKGENGLLDASTWTDGEFHFSADDQTTQQTLTGETAELITTCDRMLALSKFLKQEQVRTASYLVRNQQLSRAQFEQKIGKQSACDIHQLWRVYELSDGNRCLSDVLRACPMTRAEWVPSVYALINLGLIGVSDSPLTKLPGMYLEPTPLDLSSVDSFISDWCEADQVFLRAAFLYFLQLEHHRFERTGSRYALAIYSFATTNLLDGNCNPFTKDMMKEANARIVKTKRKLDIVGHFEGDEYIMLLPETDSAGAAVFANRIVDLVKKPPLFPGDEVLVASFGIGSVPDEVRDLNSVVAAAKAAKAKSKMMGAPVCVYGES